MASADFKTAIRLTPSGSQIFIVCLCVAACISLVSAVVLALSDKPYVHSFIGISVLFVAVAAACWFFSRVNADLGPQAPANLSINGSSVSIDPRSLSSEQAIAGFTKLAEILSRKQLPVPDGLIDSDGNVVEGSSDQARMIVENLNASTRIAAGGLNSSLNSSQRLRDEPGAVL